LQKLIAEFLGTFALIFFGAGRDLHGSIFAWRWRPRSLGIALAHGLAIAIMVSALVTSPAGHFIPGHHRLLVTKRVNTVDNHSLIGSAQLACATPLHLLKASSPKIPGAPSLWARRNSREIFRAGRE